MNLTEGIGFINTWPLTAYNCPLYSYCSTHSTCSKVQKTTLLFDYSILRKEKMLQSNEVINIIMYEPPRLCRHFQTAVKACLFTLCSHMTVAISSHSERNSAASWWFVTSSTTDWHILPWTTPEWEYNIYQGVRFQSQSCAARWARLHFVGTSQILSTHGIRENFLKTKRVICQGQFLLLTCKQTKSVLSQTFPQ